MYRSLIMLLLLTLGGCDFGAEEKSSFGFAANEIVAMPEDFDMADTYAFLHVINFQAIEIQLREQFADYEGQGIRYYLVPLIVHNSDGSADRLMLKIDIDAPDDWPYREALLDTLHADVVQSLDAYNDSL